MTFPTTQVRLFTSLKILCVSLPQPELGIGYITPGMSQAEQVAAHINHGRMMEREKMSEEHRECRGELRYPRLKIYVFVFVAMSFVAYQFLTGAVS